MNLTNGILDASGAPHLTWQLEEGCLSSSKSCNELEFDSNESVGSGSDSSSSKSEYGIFGGGNPKTKVLSRSSFSFSFESVTEDLDLLNENSVDSVYFSIPLVYCID